MIVSIIVAAGKNNEIGEKNALMWKLKGDMRFFKNTTMGHSIIMGRKTFESLPFALPGRKNIVISRNEDFNAVGANVVTSAEKALQEADTEEVFVIGGQQIYKLFLPICDRLYITEVDGVFPQADAFFPQFDKLKFSSEILGEGEENGLKYKHILYKRKDRLNA